MDDGFLIERRRRDVAIRQIFDDFCEVTCDKHDTCREIMMDSLLDSHQRPH